MNEASSPSPSSFQNHIRLQYLYINKCIPSPSTKKLFKYIHNLEIADEFDLNPKTARTKTVTALNMERNSFYFMEKPLELHRLQKFIKPHQKSIRMLKEHLKKPELLKLLPLLSETKLNQENFNWQLFISRLRFHTLSVNIGGQLFHNHSSLLSRETILQHSTSAFHQTISRLKSLENLHLTLYLGVHDNLELIANLFQKIDFRLFASKISV